MTPLEGPVFLGRCRVLGWPFGSPVSGGGIMFYTPQPKGVSSEANSSKAAIRDFAGSWPNRSVIALKHPPTGSRIVSGLKEGGHFISGERS